MGISILEMVLQWLREADFLASVSFPGQKYPAITQPVAAVHIEKVDRSNQTVTVEVSIICPASLGGTRCEVEALRATEVLRWAGGNCIQNGCRYDGLAQMYVVSILATFTCVTEAENCSMGPGFRIFIEDRPVDNVVSFRSQQTVGVKPVFEMGENGPIGIHEGSSCWEFTLEELIPAGSAVAASLEGPFRLDLTSETVSETFTQCRWTSVRREYNHQGLRLIRSGISPHRQEATNG